MQAATGCIGQVISTPICFIVSHIDRMLISDIHKLTQTDTLTHTHNRNWAAVTCGYQRNLSLWFHDGSFTRIDRIS